MPLATRFTKILSTILTTFLLTLSSPTASYSQGEIVWQPVNNGLYGADVRCFALNASGHLFAGTIGGGVFRSTNNGETWTQINTGLGDLQIIDLAVSPSGYIFAGTYRSGIFRSTNMGNTWTQINVPGATDSDARGISEAGQIVGAYSAGDVGHGFLLANGRFTTIDVPGARSIVPGGINEAGQISGFYIDFEGTHHGFLAVLYILEDDRNGNCLVITGTSCPTGTSGTATYCWKKPNGTKVTGPCVFQIQTDMAGTPTTVTVQSTARDRNLLQASVDVVQRMGSGQLTITRANPIMTLTMSDSNIDDSTCTCP